MCAKNNGEDILYHFFQKQLKANNSDFAKSFIKQSIDALGIWIHPEFYQKLPVVLPFAVRDPSCRKNKETGKDEWSAPNEKGLLRDDNSLVKSIVKSMRVCSKGGLYSERTIENGFVASHIWRNTANTGELASRNPWLNTFIPNLVWLPKQISKMTDREGDFAQQYVQALSRHIYYKHCDFSHNNKLQQRVQVLWDQLPIPNGFSDETFPDISTLNFFEPCEKKVAKRIDNIEQVVVGIKKVLSEQPLDKKIIASRYTNGLPLVNRNNLSMLVNELQEYLEELK